MKTKKKILLQGIILGSYDYQENHKIFHLFTPNLGTISCIAHGARKYKSKLRGKTETLSVVEGLFHFSGKSSFYVAEELVVLSSFFDRLSYPVFWEISSFLRFLLLLSFEKEEENQKIYAMFLKLLEKSSSLQEGEKARFLLYAFVLKLFIILHFIPLPQFCAHCGKNTSFQAFFHLEQGWLCKECIEQKTDLKKEEEFYGFVIKIIYSQFEELINLSIEKTKLAKLKALIQKITSRYLGKNWNEFENQENPFNFKS